jgi:hypothetical protein
MSRIRNTGYGNPDPHQSKKPDPDPHQSQNSGVVVAQNGAVEAQRAVDAYKLEGGAQNLAIEGL